jgi:hypothetical protein
MIVTGLLLAALGSSIGMAAADPFKLGAETNQYIEQTPDGYPAYPTPKMVPVAPKQSPVPPAKHNKPIKLNVEQNQQLPPPQQPPRLQAQVQAAPPPGVLPNQFMGRWMVIGNRGRIQARPEYQNGIENIFTSSNSQTWNIAGAPGSYSMSSDTGVSQVQVGNCTANTAFIRYEHQVGKTMAREAIVMQLSADGRTFQGIQRISIIKPGEPGPRATVQYNLIGQRQ